MKFHQNLINIFLRIKIKEKIKKIIISKYSFSDFISSEIWFQNSVFICCNILYVAIVLLKIGVLYAHKIEFFDLIAYTQKNFWRFYNDPQEILIITGCKKICNFSIVLIVFCAQGTCAGYMVTPLIGIYISIILSLKHISINVDFYIAWRKTGDNNNNGVFTSLENIGKNESDRALPFNLWIDFPVGLSPYFELLFIVQVRIQSTFYSIISICNLSLHKYLINSAIYPNN